MADYSAFVKCWTEPEGGFRSYLQRFLVSGDSAFQHIAVWTVLQLLESGNAKLKELIMESKEIVQQVRKIGKKELPKDEDDVEDEGEVIPLAKRAAELMD